MPDLDDAELDDLLRMAILRLVDQTPVAPEFFELRPPDAIELTGPANTARPPRRENRRNRLLAAAAIATAAVVGAFITSIDGDTSETSVAVGSASVAARQALAGLAEAISVGDADAAMTIYASDAELRWNSSVVLDFANNADRKIAIEYLRQSIALNARPAVSNCIGEGPVTCDWSLRNDLYAPAGLEGQTSIERTVEINEEGLITSMRSGLLPTRVDEIDRRFFTYLDAAGGDMGAQCRAVHYASDECTVFLVSQIEPFWELNSSTNAIGAIERFAHGISTGDVELARAQVATNAQAFGALFGQDAFGFRVIVPQLRTVSSVVDGIDNVRCTSSELTNGERLADCTMNVTVEGRRTAIHVTAILVDGKILNWTE